MFADNFKMIKYKIFLILATFSMNLISYGTAFRVFHVKGVETMLAREKEQLNIQCKADIPMAYCGFIHPNGTRYSFSGSLLDAGQCSYTTEVMEADSGQWRCHIGKKGSIGLEIKQVINVRVVNQLLAAIEKNITTVHGKEITLSCATVNGLTPLRYCRFEPPTGKPFSINSEVTRDSPILNRYYFPNNKSLDRGDCAVTIRKVKYEDVGLWSCGAGLDDEKEHLDTINLDVEGLYTMSTASATGITFGAIGIAAFLVVLGFVVWKKRRFLGSMPDEGNEQELQPLPATPRSRQGSIEPPRSRQESMHEPFQSSRGSLHDVPIRRIPLHGSQPLTAQSSPFTVRRSPLHDEPIRNIHLYGSQPLSHHKSPLAEKVPIIVIQYPSPVKSTTPVISQSTSETPVISQPTSAVISQPNLASPAVSQPMLASPAISLHTSASPIVLQTTSASPAISQPTPVSSAISQHTSVSPAISQPTSVSPAISQPTSASPAISQPTLPLPAILQTKSASPVISQTED